MPDNPFVRLVQPKVHPDGTVSVIVLDKVEPGRPPAYTPRGKVTCDKCDDWCWLGTESYDLMLTGDYHGICQECAARIIPPNMKPTRNVGDR